MSSRLNLQEEERALSWAIMALEPKWLRNAYIYIDTYIHICTNIRVCTYIYVYYIKIHTYIYISICLCIHIIFEISDAVVHW